MDSEVPEMWHCLCPWVFPVWGGTGSKYASFLVLVDGKKIEVEVPLALAKTVHLHACEQQESAHTALAVKACLLGGNSNTKCSMTFVNIAVAISALAEGGAKNGFAPRPEYGGVSSFFEDFWVSERKRVLKWNFGSFW